MLPSTVMSDGYAPELVFWILVFGQETRRPNIETELLKLERYVTASCIDGTKKEVSSTEKRSVNRLAPTSMPVFWDTFLGNTQSSFVWSTCSFRFPPTTIR